MNEEIEIFPIEGTEVLDSLSDTETVLSDTEIVEGTEIIENTEVVEGDFDVVIDTEILEEETESAADQEGSEATEAVLLLSESETETELESESVQIVEASTYSVESNSSFDSLIFLLLGFMVIFLILTRLER